MAENRTRKLTPVGDLRAGLVQRWIFRYPMGLACLQPTRELPPTGWCMYRCDICDRVTEPSVHCNLIVESVPFEHPFRPRSYWRPAAQGQKARWDPDLGGVGRAIVRERRACPECHARALAIERRPLDGGPPARLTRAELAAAFRACLARNRGADGREDRYGIEVITLDPETGLASLVLTFRAAESYCCAELGCHFLYVRRRTWDAIRAELARRNVSLIPPLTVRVRGVVEAGARLESMAGFGLPCESEGYAYEALWNERDARDA